MASKNFIWQISVKKFKVCESQGTTLSCLLSGSVISHAPTGFRNSKSSVFNAF